MRGDGCGRMPRFRPAPSLLSLLTSLLMGLAVVLSVSGCSHLLPSGKSDVEGVWTAYSDAESFFQKIAPHQTTVSELSSRGLNLSAHPNVLRLNYSEVMRRFLPPAAIPGYALDDGVTECLLAKTECDGYEIRQVFVSKRRYGNFWADFFNFRRMTEVDGWEFVAVLLVKNQTVIYKLTGGKPRLKEHEFSRNPLGPFQSIDPLRIIN